MMWRSRYAAHAMDVLRAKKNQALQATVASEFSGAAASSWPSPAASRAPISWIVQYTAQQS